ncbi:hypothetical protein GLAREA_10310 [Glarea lozoyensis ATCC 20868]|uniref:Uncharacterized protein n=1 Tax=Glarea lozoyensis (strain ATCC 20868 / MF5171) TaxID=1116229 RepID=S3DRI5_GLAL2|nr:uncharacterized protein GLAREA_10310 [Glarea lozoyensis ATCC 20868]EPE34616.1 hypothetical protein GLAREA_10310 [Glarea lozoyensis ATCC 20868]
MRPAKTPSSSFYSSAAANSRVKVHNVAQRSGLERVDGLLPPSLRGCEPGVLKSQSVRGGEERGATWVLPFIQSVKSPFRRYGHIRNRPAAVRRSDPSWRTEGLLLASEVCLQGQQSKFFPCTSSRQSNCVWYGYRDSV